MTHEQFADRWLPTFADLFLREQMLADLRTLEPSHSHPASVGRHPNMEMDSAGFAWAVGTVPKTGKHVRIVWE